MPFVKPSVPGVSQIQTAVRVVKLVNQGKGLYDKLQRLQKIQRILSCLPKMDINMDGKEKHLKRQPLVSVDLFSLFGKKDKKGLPSLKPGAREWDPETGMFKKKE